MSDIKIQPSATGSATVTLTAPVSNTARTITLPDSTSTLLASEGAVTINESGADLDFRVESDNDANALFVQGSDGNVGIGISTPTNPLTVEGDGARIAFSNTATYPCLGGISAFRSGTSHGNMYIETAGGSNFNTPAERIAIEGTTGEVKISTGDLIFGTAGKGIVLGSTTNVNANTLADYEEGSFTPTFTNSGTLSHRTAKYTKIGQTVIFNAEFRCTSFDNSGSTSIRIGGLPFTSQNTSSLYGAVTLNLLNGWNQPNDWGVMAWVDPNGTEIALYGMNKSSGINYDIIKSAHFGTGLMEVQFSGTYITDS